MPSIATTFRSLNSLLPAQVRVLELARAVPDFHARYSPMSKTYEYIVQQGPVLDPFQRAFTLHVAAELNVEAMQEGARQLEGLHDFSAYANSSPIKETDPVRHILRFDICRQVWPVKWSATGSAAIVMCVSICLCQARGHED